MSKQITRLSGFVVAALVLAALAFGTTQAVAAPISTFCMNDGINYLGLCGAGGEPACDAACEAVPDYGSPASIGECIGAEGCCRCLH
jgi:hypothetical protein